MEKNSSKSKIFRFKSHFLLLILAIFFTFSLAGCFVLDVKNFLIPGKKPSNKQIYANYSKIVLRDSDSADVISTIHIPEVELLSQSTSVIASTGQAKKGYKTWFNMAAFDEDALTVMRKYFFLVDEKPKVLFVEPWASAKFDCEMVLESEVLEYPYANDNARQIAILKQVLENFRNDIRQVSSDNRPLAVSGMLVNQALTTVLVKLEPSPALASRLSGKDGLDFNHHSFEKGKIQMTVDGDIVTVDVQLGSLTKKFKISFERKLK